MNFHSLSLNGMTHVVQTRQHADTSTLRRKNQRLEFLIIENSRVSTAFYDLLYITVKNK